jgi:hypothetical protein
VLVTNAPAGFPPKRTMPPSLANDVCTELGQS